MEEWNAQIALIKARADKAKAEAKIEYYKTTEALQHKQEEAGTKLHELKTAGDEAKDVYQGVEKAVVLVFYDCAGALGLDKGHTIRLVVFCSVQPILSFIEKFGTLPYRGDNLCKKRMSYLCLLFPLCLVYLLPYRDIARQSIPHLNN